MLSKEKLLDIVNILFSQDFNKNNMLIKTKQIITEIKKDSINLSAADFDESAIDAYANIIFKNFNQYYNMFLNVDNNQQFMIRLYISNGEYIKDEKTTIIIGTNNDLNTNEIKSTQLMPSIINKNIGKYCRINGNVVEKSTFSKMKIKINKLTWTIINIIYFLTKDKSIFIKKITNLFSKFSPGYDDYKYALNNEELESFAALIWNHFIDYFTWFQKLRIDESIRITSFAKNPEGYWYGNNPELYNHIVDSNNIIIDWETFHRVVGKKLRFYKNYK